MLLLLSLACTTAPPPKETPLGAPVPADYVGVDLVGLTEGTAWPDAPVGAVRLGEEALSLAGVYAEDPEGDFSGFDAVGETPALGVLGPPADGVELDALIDLVGGVVEAVPEVAVWELWDRPDLDAVGPEDAAELACALADVHGAERFASPSPSWADGADALPWLTQFVQAGGGRCVGAFAVHLPADDHPDVDTIEAVRDGLKELGRGDLPIWDVGERFDGADPDPARVARALLVPWTRGVDRVYLHAWGDDAVALVDGSGTPTEAGRAVAVVADWIVGRDLGSCSAEGTTWTCSVRTEEARSWIVWDDSGAGTMSVPEGVTEIAYLDGTVAPVEGDTVELGEAPILLYGGT